MLREKVIRGLKRLEFIGARAVPLKIEAGILKPAYNKSKNTANIIKLAEKCKLLNPKNPKWDGIGIALDLSRLLVLDFDYKNNPNVFKEFLEKWKELYGENESIKKLLKSTLSQTTKSNGFHYFLKLPEGYDARKLHKVGVIKGLDFLTQTWAFVCPTSVGDKYYMFVNDNEVYQLKDKGCDLFLNFVRYCTEDKSKYYQYILNGEVIGKGLRFLTLQSYAGYLAIHANSLEDAKKELERAAKENCNPPFTAEEGNKFKDLLKFLEEKWVADKDKRERLASGGKKKDDSYNKLKDEVEDKIEFVRDFAGKVYAKIFEKGYYKLYDINSSKFEGYLCILYQENTGKIPSDSKIRQIKKMLEFKVFNEDLRIVTATSRFYHDREKGVIYINLNNEGKIVRITSEGWEVVDNKLYPEVCFKSNQYLSKSPIPNKEYEPKVYSKFFNLTNIEEREHKIILWAYLLAAYHPGLSKPMLFVSGDYGSGKSTLCEMLGVLVNNLIKNKLFILNQEDIRNVKVVFDNFDMVILDNISSVSGKVSDYISATVTGALAAERTLFTNDGLELNYFHNSIVVNSINDLLAKNDLKDRTLTVYLENIQKKNKEYKTEEEILKELNKIMPDLLGLIFDQVSYGLKFMKKVKNSVLSFRMTGFMKFVLASFKHENSPFNPYELLSAIKLNTTETALEGILGDELAEYIYKKAIEEKYIQKRLKDFYYECVENEVYDSNIRTFGRKLSYIAPILAKKGVVIERKKVKSQGEVYKIIKIYLNEDEDSGKEPISIDDLFESDVIDSNRKHDNDSIKEPTNEKEKEDIKEIIVSMIKKDNESGGLEQDDEESEEDNQHEIKEKIIKEDMEQQKQNKVETKDKLEPIEVEKRKLEKLMKEKEHEMPPGGFLKGMLDFLEDDSLLYEDETTKEPGEEDDGNLPF